MVVLLRVIGVFPYVHRFRGVDDVIAAEEDTNAFGAVLEFIRALGGEFLSKLIDAASISRERG